MGANYEQVLTFLWACHHTTEEVPFPVMIPLQDDETIAWEMETRGLIAQTDSFAPQAIDLNGETTARRTDPQMPQVQGYTSDAMTKLADSMVRYQEASLKNQEEKGDSRLKAWKKLPKIQQNIILFGGVTDQGEVPEEATSEMMSILGCQNGAQVEQFLRQSMEEHNMNLEPGLCTAINKGIFVCPEAGTPRNFTPFFTPPVGDEEEEEENSHLLKMAMQEKLDNTDIQLLTKMEVKIPTKAQDIKHHIKNFAGIAGRCFGEDSLLFQSLQKIVKHMERREPRYQYKLRQNALFGGHLLDKINWRVHQFLDSCAGREAEELEIDLLDFSEMVYQIDRRDWVTMAPSWMNKLVKKKEKRPVEEETEQGKTIREDSLRARRTRRERSPTQA